MLSGEYPKWELVYYYYDRWRNEGTIEEVHEVLRYKIRKRRGKKEFPSLGVVDSQSSKTIRSGGLDRSVDGGKKVKGRKCHIVVDSMGLLLVVVVHAANIHDPKVTLSVIEALKYRFPSLVKILADAGYRGELKDKIKSSFYWLITGSTYLFYSNSLILGG